MSTLQIYFEIVGYFGNTLILWQIHVKGRKQPFAGVFRNEYSSKFRRIRGKTPLRESLFRKVADHQRATLVKSRLWYRYFSVNFEKLSITPFLQNTSGPLPLKGHSLTHFFSLFPFYTLRKHQKTNDNFLPTAVFFLR